jgi:CRISPR-associated protein Cas2
MSERNSYVVSYDVSNAKRLRKVHKKMRGYGDPLQYSVFHCELSPKQRELMIAELRAIIHSVEDRVMIVDLGPARNRGRRAIRFLGRQTEREDDGPVVF